MDFRGTSIRRPSAGELLPALVIGIGLGSLLFVAIASVYLYSARAFVDLGNYMQMDGNARNALDVMSADIRQADGIAFYSSNALTLRFGTNEISYTLNTNQRTLNRQYGSVNQALLTDCDGVYYGVFQRNPTNGIYDSFPDALSATNSKLVEVTVLCTRSVLGRKANSTTLQSAKIVIRKQR
jgi:Tfp pilus assembly protein PilW